jgi:5-(carboxyamino)imidazole ribonucleotide mutase
MEKPIVIILMGSKVDLEHSLNISDACKGYGLETIQRVASAHKTPEHVLEIAREYEADPRPKVYITIAGRSNALSGFVDGAVVAPVIACPPPSNAFGGADVYSSLRMPSGIAPALVLEPSNAALLAAKILGLGNTDVRTAVMSSRHQAVEKIKQDDQSLR